MVDGAKHLQEEYRYKLIGNVNVRLGDIRELPFPNKDFSYVISERGLLNLPNRDCQWQTIKEAHRVLKDNGTYVMVEGTRDGLAKLNAMRAKFGLEVIEDISEDHPWSLKFDEQELREFMDPYFELVYRRYFGMYCFISKIIHPLLVAPESPKFAAKINDIARKMNTEFPYTDEFSRLSHICGWVWRKI
jgi:ubiquinone/menaquinone biosynthesis C-methylase UbiE